MSRIFSFARSVNLSEPVRFLCTGSLILLLGLLQSSNAQPTSLGPALNHELEASLLYLANTHAENGTNDKTLERDKASFESLIIKKLSEAQKILATKCDIDNETVGISLLERKNGEIYTVTMSKTNFLNRGYQESYQLSNGSKVSVKIDQPNFVNTKLIVEAEEGLFIPLTVKYPIVKGNRLKEFAFYTPAHRSLQNHSFDQMGERYIETILTNAAASLKKSGLIVPDKVINLAKLLCIVEHIDHDRFRKEESDALFKEVLTLYALNRGDCYRYSVSSAGAGGMVQMIGSTYREIRNSFPQVDMVYDFEAGMINHANAAKAMLLYLRRYNEYYGNLPAVDSAINDGYATPEELMAAGYNSNPVRVPARLSLGSNWKRGLPDETQLYLTILRSLDEAVTTAPPIYQPNANADRLQEVVYRPSRASRRRQFRVVRVTSKNKSYNRVTVRGKKNTAARSKASVNRSGQRSKINKSAKLSATKVTRRHR